MQNTEMNTAISPRAISLSLKSFTKFVPFGNCAFARSVPWAGHAALRVIIALDFPVVVVRCHPLLGVGV